MNEMTAVAKQILEGADIRLSIAQGIERPAKVDEATTASASELKAFYQSPFYKSLCKTGKDLLKKVENEHEYRIGDWAEDPLAAVHDEIDEFYYVLEHLKSIKLQDFPKAQMYEIQNLLTTAERSYNRVLIKLKPMDTPEKVQKAFQPLLYSKKAATLLTDYFDILNVEWDFGYPYEIDDKHIPTPTQLNLVPKDRPERGKKAEVAGRKYFDWITGLYERYDVEKAQSIISEKRVSLTDETEIGLFTEADSLLR